MKVLFDTNVVLDVLLDREPHVTASAEILSRAEKGEVSGWLCATTVTTLFYLITKAADSQRALADVRKPSGSVRDRPCQPAGSRSGALPGVHRF